MMALSPKIRIPVLERDGWRCVRCSDPNYLEVHHIMARQDGGGDEPSNLATLCRSCHLEWTNLADGRMTWEDWLTYPSYHALLSFWIAMKNLWEDGQVCLSNGDDESIAARVQEMERAYHSIQPTRQRRTQGEAAPPCLACGRTFPRILPPRLYKFPEECGDCREAAVARILSRTKESEQPEQPEHQQSR